MVEKQQETGGEVNIVFSNNGYNGYDRSEYYGDASTYVSTQKEKEDAEEEYRKAFGSVDNLREAKIAANTSKNPLAVKIPVFMEYKELAREAVLSLKEGDISSAKDLLRTAKTIANKYGLDKNFQIAARKEALGNIKDKLHRRR